MRYGCVALLLAWPTPLPAQPQPDEPTAADVEDAPVPGQESGRLDAPPDDSTLRTVARASLFVPRVALEVTAAPLRVGLWAYDRYQLRSRFRQLFFDDTNTYGLYPTAAYDTTYGVTGGARFVHRDLFGEREHFSLRGGLGGEYKTRLRAALRSGARLGERVQTEVSGDAERRPNDPFYGIGNTADGMEARHRQEVLRATTTIAVRLVSRLHLVAAAATTNLTYSAADAAMPIDEIYGADALAGWDGVRNLHGELELRWDSRRHVTKLDHHAVFETGWLLAAYTGRIHQLESGRDYWRYGGNIQHFWSIGAGPRAIATRFHVDAVTGEIGDVAFTQLPQLGGLSTLRGYPRDRFRDRIAVAGSLEYEWDLGRHVMASLFVDAGRVMPRWNEPPTNIRVGYGMSVQLHDRGSYLGGFSLATSIDGGVFLNLELDPVFDVEPRVEQR